MRVVIGVEIDEVVSCVIPNVLINQVCSSNIIFEEGDSFPPHMAQYGGVEEHGNGIPLA